MCSLGSGLDLMFQCRTIKTGCMYQHHAAKCTLFLLSKSKLLRGHPLHMTQIPRICEGCRTWWRTNSRTASLSSKRNFSWKLKVNSVQLALAIPSCILHHGCSFSCNHHSISVFDTAHTLLCCLTLLIRLILLKASFILFPLLGFIMSDIVNRTHPRAQQQLLCREEDALLVKLLSVALPNGSMNVNDSLMVTKWINHLLVGKNTCGLLGITKKRKISIRPPVLAAHHTKVSPMSSGLHRANLATAGHSIFGSSKWSWNMWNDSTNSTYMFQEWISKSKNVFNILFRKKER